MKHRSGYTLTELLLALTIGSVIVTVVVGLLHMLIQIESESRTHLGQQEIRAQLAKQFRSDVHAANRFTPLAKEEGMTVAWRFQFDSNRSVEYRVDGDALSRIERSDNETIRGESFAIPPGSRVTIEPSTDAKSPNTDAKSPNTDAKSPNADAKSPNTDAKSPNTDAKSPNADAKSPKIVQLRIGLTTESGKESSRATLIEAGLAIDHRFHRNEEP